VHFFFWFFGVLSSLSWQESEDQLFIHNFTEFDSHINSLKPFSGRGRKDFYVDLFSFKRLIIDWTWGGFYPCFKIENVCISLFSNS